MPAILAKLVRKAVELLETSPIVGAHARHIDDCPIAKTSRVDCQNFPVLSGKISGLLDRAGRGRIRPSIGVKHGRGLRFDEGSVTAVGGRSQGLIPGAPTAT